MTPVRSFVFACCLFRYLFISLAMCFLLSVLLFVRYDLLSFVSSVVLYIARHLFSSFVLSVVRSFFG